LTFESEMRLPRLARLSADGQELAVQMLLAGGNLTEVAAAVGVSHPTLRRRVAALKEQLALLKAGDEAEIEALLEKVQAGTLAPEQAARLIGEINGKL
jgi:hypothetical protein